MEKNVLLITGGAGFIGSNFIRTLMAEDKEAVVVNIDKLTYAGNRANLAGIEDEGRYTFVQGDICDGPLIASLLQLYQPRALIHFAAESHVDRSIYAPAAFIETNVVGSSTLLAAALSYWQPLSQEKKERFRFLYLSTDEVYGSLAPDAPSSLEESPFAPNSPYAASKAAADCLVRSYNKTYGLPTLITRSANNYGPYQFPEKLIPLTILNALIGKSIPIYGDGKQRRSWLYVEDHCRALMQLLEAGAPGESYNIAAGDEMSNLELVDAVCKAVKRSAGGAPETLITHVQDRPGHDRRYSIDAGKLRRTLGWRPRLPFQEAIDETVSWYLEQKEWLLPLLNEEYKSWIELNYGGAL